jgi:hypothetical protein
MKKYLFIFSVVFTFLITGSFTNSNSAQAATKWSGGVHDTLAYFYVGAGWGSVEFTSSLYEEYSYTYRTELYWHENLHGYKSAAPYSGKTGYSNKYYDSGGTYLGGMTNYNYSGSYRHAAMFPGDYTLDSATLSTDMYTNPGYRAKFKHTVGYYVYKSGGWAYVADDYYWKYIN